MDKHQRKSLKKTAKKCEYYDQEGCVLEDYLRCSMLDGVECESIKPKEEKLNEST